MQYIIGSGELAKQAAIRPERFQYAANKLKKRYIDIQTDPLIRKLVEPYDRAQAADKVGRSLKNFGDRYAKEVYGRAEELGKQLNKQLGTSEHGGDLVPIIKKRLKMKEEATTNPETTKWMKSENRKTRKANRASGDETYDFMF